MIGSLSGRVLRIDGVTALIECGGVGYEVDMPVTSLSKLKVNENAFVYVQHIVREDAQISMVLILSPSANYLEP